MVVSMGTGTSFVGVKDGIPVHLGGIGIGGGTIIGLSKLMLNTNDIDKIQELASGGKVGNIDLRIGDISKNPLPGLDLEITASNFGKDLHDLRTGDPVRHFYQLAAGADLLAVGDAIRKEMSVC